MDGVILDTKSQYDIFWKRIGREYNIGIPNFEKKNKENNITWNLKKNSDLSYGETEKLIDELEKFESQIEFQGITGSVNFAKRVKAEGFAVGLVTSSTNTKMIGVNKNKLFNGKPDPECYLLSAKKLSMKAEKITSFWRFVCSINSG